MVKSVSAARSLATASSTVLLLVVVARGALGADEVVERGFHRDDDRRAVDHDVELDLAVHVGGRDCACSARGRDERAASEKTEEEASANHGSAPCRGRQPRRVAPFAPAAGIERGRPEARDFHGEQVRHGAHAAAALVDDRRRHRARPAALRTRRGSCAAGSNLPSGPMFSAKGRFQRPGDVTGDRVQRFHLAAITCAGARVDQGLVRLAQVRDHVAASRAAWPAAPRDEVRLEVRGLLAAGRPRRHAACQACRPPSSTATASWPIHLSIHHRRPQ